MLQRIGKRKMGIGKDFDPSQPVTSENTPSPWKNNPEKASADARKGGIAKANRSDLAKAQDRVRKHQLKLYSNALEKMLAKCHIIMKKVEKELLTPRTIQEVQPDGSFKTVVLPISEGKLELILKYQKQLHEQVLGKPKQIVDGKIDVPITLIIQEEPEPEDDMPEAKVIDVTPSNVKTEEADDSAE
jgi:hypothetical protein